MITTNHLKFYPNYIVRFKKNEPDTFEEKNNHIQHHLDRQPPKRKPTFDISYNSAKKLKKACNLFRFMQEYGKRKAVFVTLTLPAKQRHTTNQLNNKALKPLLNILRNVHGIRSYIVKLEYQGNGNAHWHLIIDKQIHWGHIRRAWNGVLLPLGYINDYQNTFLKVSLAQYMKLRKSKTKTARQKARQAYLYGTKTNWSNPNSVDVKRIKSYRTLNKYLVKYMIKKNKNEAKIKQLLQQRETKVFRHWTSSYNLSNVKYFTVKDDNIKVNSYYCYARQQAKKVITDFHYEILIFDDRNTWYKTDYKRFLWQHHYKEYFTQQIHHHENKN